MTDVESPETENNPASPEAGAKEGSGNEAEERRGMDVRIRITPLSLLWSSVIGTVVLGVVFVTGALLAQVFSTATGLPGMGFLLPASLGLWFPFALGVLLLVVFATGYRQHGHLVPTEARVQEDALAVKVPPAWGKLIRDELYLSSPHLGPSDPTPRTKSESSTANSSGPRDGDFVVWGTAPEWWDPGTYEVHVASKDADLVRSRLTDGSVDTPGP